MRNPKPNFSQQAAETELESSPTPSPDRNNIIVLTMNTLAFTVCFAVWMLNGVLVTFLVDNGVFDWSPVEIGWLFGIPVLTGSIFRLPAGILTDKFGGKPVFSILLLICTIPLFLLSYVDSFIGFAICSFGFGLCGVGFSIGIAFTSVWFPKQRQGTALGIFGAGNAGASLTSFLAPTMLKRLTDNGANIEGWRTLPTYYAIGLIIMCILYFLLTTNKKPEIDSKNLRQLLQPLKDVRVWRFGLYYFLVFGCFVAFSQWLVSYFLNVYFMSLVAAGIFAALFSFPSGVIRALGGWFSDIFGARKIMYFVLGLSMVISAMLSIPKMDIYSPGTGIQAKESGTVTSVSDNLITVDDIQHPIIPISNRITYDEELLVLPIKDNWQEPVVKAGDRVEKKELLARGTTRIHFQANIWIFATLVIIIGSVWGIGKAAVYKYIPDYFPNEVGVVGGMVGVLGGLGGFFCPIVFGYLLEYSGLWTSCWMFMFVISAISLFWMHHVVQKLMHERNPGLMKQINSDH